MTEQNNNARWLFTDSTIAIYDREYNIHSVAVSMIPEENYWVSTLYQGTSIDEKPGLSLPCLGIRDDGMLFPSIVSVPLEGFRTDWLSVAIQIAGHLVPAFTAIYALGKAADEEYVQNTMEQILETFIEKTVTDEHATACREIGLQIIGNINPDAIMVVDIKDYAKVLDQDRNHDVFIQSVRQESPFCLAKDVREFMQIRGQGQFKFIAMPNLGKTSKGSAGRKAGLAARTTTSRPPRRNHDREDRA